MADQGRWFKLWTTAPDDPDLGSLSLEDFGRWCIFGVYLKVHGVEGVVTLTDPCIPLRQKFRVNSFDDVVLTLRHFPNCVVDVVTTANVTIKVTWLNWRKYQGDFSGDRVRQWRGKQPTAVTAKEEKRREEKRTPIVPVNGDGFGDFWKLYPRRAAKQAAVSAWKKLDPSQDLRKKILEALAVQVKLDYGKREADKIPHAATWINGRRWEDEVTEGKGRNEYQLL